METASLLPSQELFEGNRSGVTVEEDPDSKLMNEDICIHAWPCSYYLDPEKRWVYGRLSLTPLAVRFTADKTGELLVHFHLSSICEIKKESSSFIFSSLTILEKENTKHWFSSLQPNRNVVFNILEHFWREQLLARPGAGAPQTTKGKELTGLLSASQKRLEDTAKVLHYQGEQFGNIMSGLTKIDSDLDVADRLLTELESPPWWPFSGKVWKGPLEAKPKEAAMISGSKNQEGVIIRIPVIITHRTNSSVTPGKLTLLVTGLEISDSNSQVIHWFELKDIDDIKVHTPYEISVRQRFIGKPDTSYRLLSAKMPEAIPILEMQFSKKIQFLEDALGFVGARKSPQTDLGNSIWQAATGLVVSTEKPGSSSGGGNGSQLQLQKQEQIVSESETQELKQILRKLKSLALETDAELERQDEVLDVLTTSVDRATLNIDKHNRRMKKLT
uniref:Synaptosomal-associated protein 47 n=1 Tax=Pelodiscus sinensis TaxID=13735 RepID=K7FR65_PELSI|nr:synaptosomal-associated protein 47 isoform X2 [Pelodiscus sinensis]XP_014432360.1 synaptosomal-associated protein 47 isoform X2 [Pelodiscus sinensis]XP_014432361.1 synaptosomal-associated protein 47 isoform X2 [Pelodiscus sinensis]XP_025043865.1 synaptosomal-associated protein 47 isoform X2 [Pelodiscus sinensis]|eukprot:XP_006129842.1 synaptosomal-associated protein 47 isoform X2 [Pelodiscus sinensis]